MCTTVIAVANVVFTVMCAAGRTMPFRLSELAQISVTLRDVCLGIIDLTHPDTRPVTQSTRLNAIQQLDVLAYVFRVCLSVTTYISCICLFFLCFSQGSHTSLKVLEFNSSGP